MGDWASRMKDVLAGALTRAAWSRVCTSGGECGPEVRREKEKRQHHPFDDLNHPRLTASAPPHQKE
jgi:hypothetical protein